MKKKEKEEREVVLISFFFLDQEGDAKRNCSSQ